MWGSAVDVVRQLCAGLWAVGKRNGHNDVACMEAKLISNEFDARGQKVDQKSDLRAV